VWEGEAGAGVRIEKTYSRGPLQVKVLVSRKPHHRGAHYPGHRGQAGKNIEVEMPRFGEKLEQFGISDYASPPPELVGDAQVRTRRTYTFEPFLSGDYKIPAPPRSAYRDRGRRRVRRGPDGRTRHRG